MTNVAELCATTNTRGLGVGLLLSESEPYKTVILSLRRISNCLFAPRRGLLEAALRSVEDARR